MGGKDMLMRHIMLLPEDERDAILALMEQRPYDQYLARRGARRIVAKNIVPALGFEELE